MRREARAARAATATASDGARWHAAALVAVLLAFAAPLPSWSASPSGPTAIDDAVERFRTHRPARFVEPERRELAEIVVRGAHDGRAQVAALAGMRARLVAAQLAAGVPFADVATALSEAPSRHAGGALGALARGALPPALRAPAFAAAEGEVVGPIEGPSGGLWWLRVVAVQPSVMLAVDAQRARSAAIVEAMHAEARRRAALAPERAAPRAEPRAEPRGQR